VSVLDAALLAFDPAYVDCRWGHFNIGEHAIVRLFMRSPVQRGCAGKPAALLDHQATPVRSFLVGPEAQQLFREQLALLAKADPYWETFEKTPLREFLTHANHFVRQSHTPTSALGKA
jgi:hypothetical protein